MEGDDAAGTAGTGSADGPETIGWRDSVPCKSYLAASADDKDMGNTNFSIVLPRLAFTRSAGAILVAKAVRERLDVPPCTTNARHDVVVRDPEELKVCLILYLQLTTQVSGSAYKIIQHRAYHHGTMLISSDLSTLGRALRSSSPNMVSKGVESMRVPVSTINLHRSPSAREITHGSFVSAVLGEFADVYGPSDVQIVSEQSVFGGGLVDTKSQAGIRDGMAELQGWEWAYGQTPAFENHFTGSLSCGEVRCEVESKHGVINSMTLEITSGGRGGEEQQEDEDALERIAQCCLGLRYEGLDGVGTFLGDSVRPDLSWEVVSWLQSHM